MEEMYQLITMGIRRILKEDNGIKGQVFVKIYDRGEMGGVRLYVEINNKDQFCFMTNRTITDKELLEGVQKEQYARSIVKEYRKSILDRYFVAY